MFIGVSTDEAIELIQVLLKSTLNYRTVSHLIGRRTMFSYTAWT